MKLAKLMNLLKMMRLVKMQKIWEGVEKIVDND